MRGIYPLVFALAAGPAAARVYQWVDPDSRNVYLSGTPPAWYRSATPGPRVLVFDDGKLVDDTGIGATEEEARELRERALAEEQRRREAEAEAAAAPAEPVPEEATAEGGDARTKAEMQALVEQYLKSVLVEKLPLLLGGAAGPGSPGPDEGTDTPAP